MSATLIKNQSADATSPSLLSESTNHSVQFFWTNAGGSVTALDVDLEGSLDGTNWSVLASHAATAGEITAKKGMFHVLSKPVTYVRVVADITDSGTTTYSVVYEGFK